MNIKTAKVAKSAKDTSPPLWECGMQRDLAYLATLAVNGQPTGLSAPLQPLLAWVPAFAGMCGP